MKNIFLVLITTLILTGCFSSSDESNTLPLGSNQTVLNYQPSTSTEPSILPGNMSEKSLTGFSSPDKKELTYIQDNLVTLKKDLTNAVLSKNGKKEAEIKKAISDLESKKDLILKQTSSSGNNLSKKTIPNNVTLPKNIQEVVTNFPEETKKIVLTFPKKEQDVLVEYIQSKIEKKQTEVKKALDEIKEIIADKRADAKKAAEAGDTITQKKINKEIDAIREVMRKKTNGNRQNNSGKQNNR